MKNPNGYGSVVKLSGNRRKPFCARKTSGWNDKGHPIYLVIGYYAERQDAMIALAEYNRNPFDIDLSKITMKELFEKWSARDFQKMSKSSASSHKSAFKHCTNLHNLPYKNIKAYQMQEMRMWIFNPRCNQEPIWSTGQVCNGTGCHHQDEFIIDFCCPYSTIFKTSFQ